MLHKTLSSDLGNSILAVYRSGNQKGLFWVVPFCSYMSVVCYKEVEISSTDSRRLDEAINAIRGQVMTYNNKAALTRYELSCNRTEKDKTTNSVYNTMCINKALETSDIYLHCPKSHLF